ncbi:formimidoylglutamate deiminase [Agrobacterium larrymoorei]|uniref:Formimidoylglutamate deiminase n=1 Tax=Agrobacterium larrymoorei TaxID=160699 RepID=A0A4D7DQD9_9HYPH|nr:formimidoylglutamate deiminase [Agrobacterium larrymoorei]QCI96579.1 formimidoylglutamate deiminase [Agrobacterium larrymoorei]QYA07999.1 formimidoylglutamate deiminase [Agrobacterium larrymoorei]
MSVHAKSALLPTGWAKNVRIEISDGKIASVNENTAALPGDELLEVLVPAMPNLHSHAFQRAMAGMVETRGATEDSFWSWRMLMYRFALTMTPEQMEAVAAQLYVEMLEAGFGRVGEFHYLHHDKDGGQYANIAELAERIAAAAYGTGISLTLLPVLYAHSGFGGQMPVEGQRRFINSPDSFARLLEGCRKAVSGVRESVVGVAPHSLRAVTPEQLQFAANLAPDAPIHIHIAEQVKEVEDCIAWSGKRPVQWLLDNAEVTDRWCLIHATHMTQQETEDVAKSGAVAGLCPITEANLGDGTFPAVEFLAHGGSFGVGSDSNVLIGVGEELRQLEYSQRLAHRARNVIAPANGSTGRSLFDAAMAGGAKALGAKAGIDTGRAADLVSLDMSAAPYLEGDHILDGWIFGNLVKPDRVWINGRLVVRGGRHVNREEIARRFRHTMSQLLSV